MALHLPHLHHPFVTAATPSVPTTGSAILMRAVPLWQRLGMLSLHEPEGPDALHYWGNGAYDFACGRCGTMLARSMERGHLRGVAMRCQTCGRWNAV